MDDRQACDGVRQLLEGHLAELSSEELASAQSVEALRELLTPLTRSVARSWAILNPDFDGDAFYPISNLWVEHGRALGAHALSSAVHDRPGDLRSYLVGVALTWQERYGVAPAVTSTLSELDAALLVGLTEAEYAQDCGGRTAVTKGFDFRHGDLRYQVKASRPSGKPGSTVTLVAQAKNMDWDRLVWVLYDTNYNVVEAWMWEAADYEREISPLSRVSPKHMRAGRNLLAPPSQPGCP